MIRSFRRDAAPAASTEVLRRMHRDLGFLMNTLGEPRRPSLDGLLEEAFEECEAIESLAHFSEGTLDCLVRWLEPERDRDEDLLFEQEGRPGRQLVERMVEFDRALGELRTGYLMRVVAGTARGGCYVGRINDGLHVVALTLHGGEAVTAMDERMNRLVSRIRGGIHHLSDELPGGAPCGELTAPSPDGGLSFVHDQGDDAVFEQWRAVSRRHVNTADLHYAAWYRDWEPVCRGDVFESLPLEWFSTISVGARRTRYRNLGQELRYDLARLRNVMRSFAPADIERLVLDVQAGAVFFHWPNGGKEPGDFLMGVSLDQYAVQCAERRLHALAADLGESGLL